VLKTKFYSAPNYDIGLIYAYLKKDPNLNVRLVSSCSWNNLQQYDKIYVFKQSPYIPHPSGHIKNYYKLPVEEYGPGFIDKPLRPFLLETRDMLPDCSCYNNMILFSLNYPKNKIAWKIDSWATGKKYQPIRLYEQFEGEELKKDYPTTKFCLLYDNPTDILNNQEKWEYYQNLLSQKHKFLFTQTLDISKLNDTNILEQVITKSKYANFRRHMVITQINDNVDWLVNYLLNEKYYKLGMIWVKLPTDTTPEKCFETLLLMNYYNHKTHFRLNLRPMWEKGYLENYDLALLAFRYLSGKPQYMSYYEYVFNISCLRAGVPKNLIHTGRDWYERIFSQYGMTPTIRRLEDWLKAHPQFEEQIFIGGSSHYDKQRRKYYDKGRGGFNIKSSVDNIGT